MGGGGGGSRTRHVPAAGSDFHAACIAVLKYTAFERAFRKDDSTICSRMHLVILHEGTTSQVHSEI